MNSFTRRLLTGSTALAVTATMAATVTGTSATAASDRGDAGGQSAAHRSDNRPGPQTKKQERLKNAEVLRSSGREIDGDDAAQQNQGLIETLTSKIINNLQITVKNIHIRYEDSVSVPGVSAFRSLSRAELNTFHVASVRCGRHACRVRF